ncbi:MAG: LTA synthase family protein [Deltaproteobacteria bacterium]|nr:MAG: LTA synthase family protein [Deltaproteobacteria bacterium]
MGLAPVRRALYSAALGGRTSTEPARFERLDRWLALLLGVPIGLLALGTQAMTVSATARGPISGLGWVGAMWSQAFAFLALILLGAAALTASTGTRWRAPVRGAVVFGVLAAVGLDLLARAAPIVTGTAYSFHAVAYFWGAWDEVRRVAASILDPQGLGGQILLLAAIVGGLVAFLAWRQDPVVGHDRRQGVLVTVGASVLSACLACFPPAPAQVPVSTATEPLLWMVRSARHGSGPMEEPPVRHAPELLPPEGKPPNLVIITLESVGRYVTSFGESGYDTTPKLRELAASSRFFDRTYVTYPHSTKAMVPMFCGVEPWASMRPVDSWPGGLRAECLPKVLAEQGYDTVFFRSAMGAFENWPELSEGLGFQEFYAEEDLPTEGFERANYFGYEDDILLEPSRAWLREHGDAPFLMLYNTGTPHHDYQLPSRYERIHFSDDDEHDRYLNAVVYVDHFIAKVLDLYREEGLYEDTVFIVVGDHGEGFGLHRERFHDLSMYEEVVRVPFLLHHGDRFTGVESTPVSQMDLPGTALEALGFTQTEPVWGSALRPEAKRHFATGWHVNRAAMVVDGDYKLIHRFGDMPDELYDVAHDEREGENLADAEPERVEALRTALTEWYAERRRWARWMVAHTDAPEGH